MRWRIASSSRPNASSRSPLSSTTSPFTIFRLLRDFLAVAGAVGVCVAVVIWISPSKLFSKLDDDVTDGRRDADLDVLLVVRGDVARGEVPDDARPLAARARVADA